MKIKIYVDKLPNSCDECKLCINLDDLGARDCPSICGITQEELYDEDYETRNKKCPLILLKVEKLTHIKKLPVQHIEYLDNFKRNCLMDCIAELYEAKPEFFKGGHNLAISEEEKKEDISDSISIRTNVIISKEVKY